MIKTLYGRYNKRKKSWDLVIEEFTRFPLEHLSLEFLSLLNERTIKRYINNASYYKCRAYQKS